MEKTFSAKQAEEIRGHTVMDPTARKEMIMHHLQAINHNECGTIRAFGLRVDTNFMLAPARQIQPPSMEYADRKTIKPKNGEWAMNYRCDEMEVISTSPTTFSWTILNTDQNLLAIRLKQFAKMVWKIVFISVLTSEVSISLFVCFSSYIKRAFHIIFD